MLKRKYLLLCFLFFVTELTLAQKHNFIKYSVSEGLPQSQVFAACPDSRGYIWFGTDGGGLSRFDGYEFKNYGSKDGLASDFILSIFEDQQKRIWVGTERGVSLYDGKSFESILFNQKQIKNVRCFHQATDSTVWMGSNNGILAYQMSSKKVVKKKLHPALDQATLYNFFTGKNSLWVASTRGAFAIEDEVTQLSTNTGLAGNEVIDFAQAKNGELWATIFNVGISVINEKEKEVIGFIAQESAKSALCAYTAPDGKIWIGSVNQGLSIFNPVDSTWLNYKENPNAPRNNRRASLPNNHIRKIVKDQWENIWIATSGDGVTKYQVQFFNHYNRDNGLAGNRVYALCEDHLGRIWASGSSNGIAIHDSLGFQTFEQDSGFFNVKCKTIFQDSKERMWFGTEGKGVAVFDTTGFKNLTEEIDFLPSNTVNNIIEDSNGQIWISTRRRGLAKIIDRDTLGFSVEPFGILEGLPDLNISSLKNGPLNKLWFTCTTGKIGTIELDKVTAIYDKKHGLPNSNIVSITFDKYKRMWVGTEGDGLFYADHSSLLAFKPFVSDKQLSSNNIDLLIFDKTGNLWVGGQKGLDKIIFSKNGKIRDVQYFGKNEGFLGIETCDNAAIRDSSGNLWFGTVNGLSRHFPSKINMDDSPPILHFNKVSLFYKDLEDTEFSEYAIPFGGIKNNLELPYDKNHLSFEFNAVHLDKPRTLTYRWRLMGQETEWSPLSDKTSANYPNLAPGNYTFEVQACREEIYCADPIKTSFTVLKPFWQENWFRLLALILSLILIAATIYYWVNKVKKNEAIKREKLEMKNHVLQLEQKALQLQMNPHFIFNALNSIQSLVATKDYSVARREINNFASLMRGILNNSRKEKISLQEEINTLEQYLKMEQFCQQNKFNYQISPPQKMNSEEIEIPPMLLQPFVENAVIHGLSHLDHPGELNITFSIKNELLECMIVDNGIGRKKAEALRNTKKPGHQSTAMQVNQERLEAIKLKRKYKALEISDVIRGTEIGGTKVVVRLPLETGF